jgi:hypothetical protein
MKNTVQNTVPPSGTSDIQTSWVGSAFDYLRALGPYVALELILPGGTVVAALFWLYRHRRASPAIHAVGALKVRASAFVKKCSRQVTSLATRLQISLCRRSPARLRVSACCSGA